MKKLTILFFLLATVIVSYCQHVTSVDTSEYGRRYKDYQNWLTRAKIDSAFLLPRKQSLRLSTKDTAAQLFIKDNSLWFYSYGQYYQVAGGGAARGGPADGLVSVGAINLSDTTVTIVADVVWILYGITHVKSTNTIYDVPLTALGYIRRDLVYADSAGNLDTLKGIPDTSIAVVRPLPPGTIAVTTIYVTHTDISQPLPSYPVGWYITGNSGIDSTNFIGTTDTASLSAKTNNTLRMKIKGDGSLFSFGGDLSAFASHKYLFRDGPVFTNYSGSESLPAFAIGETGGSGIYSNSNSNLLISSAQVGSFIFTGTLNPSALASFANPKMGIGTLSPSASLSVYSPIAPINRQDSYLATKDLFHVSNSTGNLTNIDFTGALSIKRNAANVNSVLDINDTSRGILIPRMTTTQRDNSFHTLGSITPGAAGTGYNGGSLVTVTGGGFKTFPIVHATFTGSGVTGYVVDYPGYGGDGTAITISVSGGTGATATANTSTTIANGMLIYNSTLDSFQYWLTDHWATMGSGSSVSHNLSTTLGIGNDAGAQSIFNLSQLELSDGLTTLSSGNLFMLCTGGLGTFRLNTQNSTGAEDLYSPDNNRTDTIATLYDVRNSGIATLQDAINNSNKISADTVNSQGNNWTHDSVDVYTLVANTFTIKDWNGNPIIDADGTDFTRYAKNGSNLFSTFYQGSNGLTELRFNDGTTRTTGFSMSGTGQININQCRNFSNNAAAITGGLVAGDVYRNADVLMIVH